LGHSPRICDLVYVNPPSMITRKQKKELDKLIQRYLQGKASSQQSAFIEKYYDYFESREDLQLTEEQTQAWKESLLANIKQGIARENQAKLISLHRRLYIKVAAAAILLLTAGAYWYFNQPQSANPPLAKTTIQNDVLPGTTRATLILADGRQIVLDTAQNGILAKEGATNITNADGTLVYAPGLEGEMIYNTLITHKGERYPLTLSDGTKIILDASTTIKYPVAFATTERTVEINGRAWFEVAKNAQKPFYVVKGDKKVQVLGTHFDVNAFDNEADLKITLVEGSVQVINGNAKGILKPGQQAVLSKNSQDIKMIPDADIEQATAWKNGQFLFHSADLGAILREIERWYDVEVEIRGELPRRTFFLEGTRNAKLSELLRGFEVNKIPFKIDGEKRRLIVNP
jgi:transmembrane sensor